MGSASQVRTSSQRRYAHAGADPARIVATWLVPAASLIVLTLVAVLPWGLPPAARFVLPLLPYLAIHYWCVARRGWMPIPLVCASGLAIDVLTRGPLGFWSLIFLAGLAIARQLGPGFCDTSFGRWSGFIGVLLLLGVLQWTLASVYFVEPVDWRPFAIAVVIVSLCYPIYGFLFGMRPQVRRIDRDVALIRGV